MAEVYAIQHFAGEIWKTIYLTTFEGDATEAYTDLSGANPKATLRLVMFRTQGLDFVAVYARDFLVMQAQTA